MDIRELAEIEERQRRVEQLIATVAALQNETASKLRELGIKPRRVANFAEGERNLIEKREQGFWE